MIGDINFFLYPLDDDGYEAPDGAETPRYCVGEIDVMIADNLHRGKGLGKAAVLAFLHYIYRKLPSILQQYEARNDENKPPTASTPLSLKHFMVKIKETNTASLALFKGLGFQQQGSVNYFGEIKLVLVEYEPLVCVPPECYSELLYLRTSK